MISDRASTERILAYVAVGAFVAAAVTVLPGFGPHLQFYYGDPNTNAPVVMAKADRLPLASGNCTEQDWPNISSDCLRHASSMQAATNVRFVAPR
jgi:hypothetical protein